MNRKIRTWVEISLNDLEHNYREISSRLPDGCQMLGVCKANAYGHGAVRVAQRLQRAGCQWVAVNCYDEAEELRAAGVTMNILLLGPQAANIAVDLATLGVTRAQPLSRRHRPAAGRAHEARDRHGPHGL